MSETPPTPPAHRSAVERVTRALIAGKYFVFDATAHEAAEVAVTAALAGDAETYSGGGDDEEFCPRCAAGVDSPEHHERCVIPGIAEDGEPAPARASDAGPGMERCPRCGGLNGRHGLVHARYGNGGGGNAPCPMGQEESDRD